MITFNNISTIRLINQRIITNDFKTAKDIVNWMGAIQAQDYKQAKWALGARLPHLTAEQIETAFNQGDFIRTHLMRPTWHFVSPDDIYWLLELTAKQIKSAMKSRNKQLELTEEVLKKSQEVMTKALEGNRSLTREELGVYLNNAGIKTADQRLPHILMEAEIDRIICSGPLKDKTQTYVLLAERVPVKSSLTKDESLALLARKYFTSHGPATLTDFVWWSGLPVSEARKALEMNKDVLFSETHNSDIYWFAEPVNRISIASDTVFLLPAFDEYLISYKNRSAAIEADHHSKAISSNGVFRPIIVVNGRISGLWKHTVKKDKLLIDLNHFRPHNQTEKRLITKAAESFGHFSGMNAEVRF